MFAHSSTAFPSDPGKQSAVLKGTDPSRTIDSRLLSHHQSTGARPLAGLVCDLSWHVNMAGLNATFNIEIDVWMRVDAPGHDCSRDQCH